MPTVIVILACTVCDSAAGQAVRVGIFDGEWWPSVLATLLPFGVMAGVITLVWRGGRSPSHGE